VLEEVSDAALVFRFMERAGADVEAEGGAAFGLVVVKEDVAEAVGQSAVADGGIGGEIAGGLGEGGDGRRSAGRGWGCFRGGFGGAERGEENGSGEETAGDETGEARREEREHGIGWKFGGAGERAKWAQREIRPNGTGAAWRWGAGEMVG